MTRRSYDDGSGPAKALVGSGISAFPVNSLLIETDAFALELANWWLPQVNRLQEIVRLRTPRDDFMGPVQTHFISGVTPDQMCLKSVTTEITSNGEFTQHPVLSWQGNWESPSASYSASRPAPR